MSDTREQILSALRAHRVNTVTELRRIEKQFRTPHSPEVTEALSSAWLHYVNSNNLLSELRALSKNYPFSSECLDEAKWLVLGDPLRSRSWNYCWIILTKIQEKQLIQKHARILAARPAMWGGKAPSATNIEQLSGVFIEQWTRAVREMLRHWPQPPIVAGR